MGLPRGSGILLHPTSLPGPYGVGDLGPAAFDFVDRLASAGQRWWQILPVGPTGYGNSPYQSYSSFAGNPLLISPEKLAVDGYLRPSDWSGNDVRELPRDRVDFDRAIAAKDRLLRLAYERFPSRSPDLDAFAAENASWLEDYALFMALKESNGGVAWYDWPRELVRRQARAITGAKKTLASTCRFYHFVQFAFARQWAALREHGRARGVSLLGDLPIFVAQDSADVWARPELFHLDKNGRPTVVAGVPPDYFAATGQLWGNPLYRWEAHESEGFRWWIDRIKAQTLRVDLVRLDHFRGFEAYWEVPAEAKTAVGGRWVPGPGAAFFDAVREAMGGLPLVAEDLGDITKEVEILRDRFDLPGMRVLQFGFTGSPGTEFHLPFTFVRHCLAYTGTHDNDTTVGWFREPARGTEEQKLMHEAQRTYALRYLGSDGREVHWDVIRDALSSVADTVVIPMQDVLGLGSEARMNVPGVPSGNWSWRVTERQLTPEVFDRLAQLTAIYGRWNGEVPPRYGPPVRENLFSPKGSTPAPTGKNDRPARPAVRSRKRKP